MADPNGQQLLLISRKKLSRWMIALLVGLVCILVLAGVAIFAVPLIVASFGSHTSNATLAAGDAPMFGFNAQNTKGRDGFKQYMNTVRAAFPDFHNSIEDIIAEGDKVVALLTYTGTHKGTLFGMEPTNKHIQYSGTAIFRIEAHQVVHGWVMGDTLGLLQQLGATTLPK